MEASPSGSRIRRFGVFEVDLDAGELRRSGLRQKLGPQPFEVLQAMLERPGELITRDELQQRLWPEGTFVDYELGLKRCVNRIREVLGDSADNPRFIETVPRRGYRFIAPVHQIGHLEVETSAALSGPPIPIAEKQDTALRSVTEQKLSAQAKASRQPGRKNFRPIFLFSVLTLMLAAASSWFFRNHQGYRSATPAGLVAQPAVLPLTSIGGQQTLPAFSPDGTRVAFVQQGPQAKDSGIYAALVGTQSVLRLTKGADDYSPVWSPDGRELAFLRDRDETFLIETVPALGGTEKTIYAGPRPPLTYETGRGGLSFSPDGNLLAFSEWNAALGRASIKLLSLRDSTARFLTFPPLGYHDRRPAFSPSGTRIAFIRSSGPTSVEEVFWVSAAGGEAKQLTFDHKQIFGPPTWTRSSDEIVFSSNRGGLAAIWRTPVSGRVPQRVPGAGPIASYPSMSQTGNELAYEHTDEEENLWRLELRDPSHARALASVLVSSARSSNLLPQFSPDGRKIAFQTGRSGYSEIWICDSDGSNPVQVTALQGFAGSPRWSPDSRYIAFDYRPQQHSEIYVVGIAGGRPHAVAAFPDADNLLPSWSRDGKWIYFTSNRGGKLYQIWKLAVKGGATLAEPLQVTQNGGFGAAEAVEGSLLYYTKPFAQGIWAMPRNSGLESAVWKGPGPDNWSNWALTRDGIYFFSSRGDLPPEIQYLAFKTGRASWIANLEKPSFYGLTASPDGRLLVYSQWDRNEREIRVIENFR